MLCVHLALGLIPVLRRKKKKKKEEEEGNGSK
jgi:hypothetical protein